MNWLTRAAWIYQGSTPDYAKLAAHQIGVLYIDPRSSNAQAVIDDLRAHNILPGIYVASSTEWFSEATTGAIAAKQASDWCNQLLPKGTLPEAPPFMADLEWPRSKAWMADFLTTYRKFQPRRPSSYTNAPFQNQTVVPVSSLINGGWHWYVQLYGGDMSPVDSAAAILEVCRIFPAELVHPFYDGAALPPDSRDGAIYTMERLP